MKTVSLETAKLLRKRRFNEPVAAYYDVVGELIEQEPSREAKARWNSPNHDIDIRHKVYAAPELAVAQQWLREKKQFDVLVDREYFMGRIGKYYAKVIRLRDGAMSETPKYRSYEKALESGIVRALRSL